MKPSRLVACICVITLAGAIAFFAPRSSPYLQYIPWMPRSLGTWADTHGISRNFVAFSGLGLVVFFAVGRRLPQVVALCVFATLLEVSQLWIPGRVYDWRDIVVSLAGIFAAWAIAWLLQRRRTA